MFLRTGIPFDIFTLFPTVEFHISTSGQNENKYQFKDHLTSVDLEVANNEFTFVNIYSKLYLQ